MQDLTPLRVVAIVPAAGRGLRMNHHLPKQYLPLGGKPIVARTLLGLQSFAVIDEIFLYCEREIVRKYGLTKVCQVIEGGERRQDSVYNALEKIGGGAGLIVIHDGVRPFLAESILMEAVAQATVHKAAVVAVPITDTVKVAKQHGFIRKTLSREDLWAVQTPQVFEYGLILEAHREARKDNFLATDDASLLERMGHPVKVVEGSTENIKITTPEDLIMAEAILREFGE
jgi:2-C-methyl-D-erythritol 4-phosphate cytidylyltransferase